MSTDFELLEVWLGFEQLRVSNGHLPKPSSPRKKVTEQGEDIGRSTFASPF